MSAAECIVRYPALAKGIFGRTRTLYMNRHFRDKYDYRNLEREINTILMEHLPTADLGFEDRLLNLPSPEDVCRTYVCFQDRRPTCKDFQNTSAV